jgi:acyl-coenzyme A synthetase/AMP-(fatty) acid ligase
VTPGLAASDAAVSQAAATAAQELGASAGGAIRVQRVAELPTTETGKVQRRRLAELYGTRAARPPQS